MAKITERIPTVQYGYFEVEYADENDFELHYEEVHKLLRIKTLTPEKKFEESLGEPNTKIDPNEKQGDGIFKRKE